MELKEQVRELYPGQDTYGRITDERVIRMR